MTALLVERRGKGKDPIYFVFTIGFTNLLHTDPRNHNHRRHRTSLMKSWRLSEGERWGPALVGTQKSGVDSQFYIPYGSVIAKGGEF